MIRIDLEPGYVLHRRDYRETSLLLEVFTPGAGRVGVVARGARGKRSPWRGLLEPFAPLLLSWTARGELATLTHAEHAGAVRAMPTERTLVGLYLNELVLRLLERHDPHPALFRDYAEGLAGLAAEGPTEPVLRIFEKRLLAEIGYALLLDQEVETGAPIRPDALYRYEPERGPVQAREGATHAGITVHGATLISLAAESLTAPLALAESKRLMRAALAVHLGATPLRSRTLLESLRAARSAQR